MLQNGNPFIHPFLAGQATQIRIDNLLKGASL